MRQKLYRVPHPRQRQCHLRPFPGWLCHMWTSDNRGWRLPPCRMTHGTHLSLTWSDCLVLSTRKSNLKLDQAQHDGQHNGLWKDVARLSVHTDQNSLIRTGMAYSRLLKLFTLRNFGKESHRSL